MTEHEELARLAKSLLRMYAVQENLRKQGRDTSVIDTWIADNLPKWKELDSKLNPGWV